MKKKTTKKLFVINTLSSFRIQYVIEADNINDAYDEITMRDSGNDRDEFDEVTQKHLGEQIIDGTEITKKEFGLMLEKLKDNPEELSSYWMGDKLIRTVKYKEDVE